MMSSCPICSLMFQSGDQVRWHARHEHQRLNEDEALEQEVSRAAAAQLDWEQFAHFARVNAQPCVSLLVATVPTGHAGRLAGIDRSWLDHLAANAAKHMAQILHPDALAVMSRRLSKVVAAAARGPYDKGLALFVGPQDIGIFRLPEPPQPRVVVRRRFAVRDLLESLLHFPPYRVLLIGGRHPRLLEGWGPHLREIAPLVALSAQSDLGVAHDHWHLLDHHLQELITAADVMLTERVPPGGERPLVVFGPPRALAHWRLRTSCSSPVIGSVFSHRLDATSQVIGHLTAPVVASWRQACSAVEVACLGHAERNGLVRWGLASTWHALSEGQASDLWVAKGFVAPTDRPTADIDLGVGQVGLLPKSDDLVEEMVRLALSSGARAHFVDEAAIMHPQPIGAQMAPDRGRARPHGVP